MTNKSELNSISKGDKIDHFLLIRKAEIYTTKANRKFLSLELGDQSCSIAANLWDDSEHLFPLMIIGEIVKVNGSLDEYQGKPQIKIEAIRVKRDNEDISPMDFLPHSTNDINAMNDELNSRINNVEDIFLLQLLKNIFTADNLNRFSTAPAGKTIHHAYIHGLIEHTLEIVKICDLMADIHPEINRDLLICGALLHDFGKIEEQLYETSFEYSDTGKMIGHIVLGAMMVQKHIEAIPDFPEMLKTQLIHLILSHQGKLEFASPVVPKTIEAITLYQADELSAKTNAYKNLILNDTTPSTWTRYSQFMSTEVFKFPSSLDNNEELETS